jgi:hypothetical protein
MLRIVTEGPHGQGGASVGQSCALTHPQRWHMGRNGLPFEPPVPPAPWGGARNPDKVDEGQP